MKWRSVRRSRNVIDRRGAGGLGGGGFSGPVRIGGGIGFPALLVLAVVLLLNGGLGGSDATIDRPLDDLPGIGEPAQALPRGAEPDQRLFEFVSFIHDDVQNFWSDTFAESGHNYRRADLIVFDRATASACGQATEAIGPHYCPADENVYLDLGFFVDLRDRFGAPGDFAQAYVLAHEIGHHVQHLMGISDQMRKEQQVSPENANDLSVRLELQADCLAGVWAFTTYERKMLEEGDLEEGLRAAAAVGDDRIQQQASGRIDPESWTHGSSEQRMRWFTTGFQDGNPNECTTFTADNL